MRSWQWINKVESFITMHRDFSEILRAKRHHYTIHSSVYNKIKNCCSFFADSEERVNLSMLSLINGNRLDSINFYQLLFIMLACYAVMYIIIRKLRSNLEIHFVTKLDMTTFWFQQ